MQKSVAFKTLILKTSLKCYDQEGPSVGNSPLKLWNLSVLSGGWEGIAPHSSCLKLELYKNLFGFGVLVGIFKFEYSFYTTLQGNLHC